MKVIDLGTKHGPSVIHFIHKVDTFFPSYGQTITPSECVGVDINEGFRRDIAGQEISFICGNIADAVFRDTLPETDFFLVCNLLHHLPNRQVVEEVIGYVLDTAKCGVWFRVKSFETDSDSGEGILLSHGLRFSWSTNSTAYTCADFFKFIRNRCSKSDSRFEAAKRIRHTSDKRVVPEDIVSSSFYYEPTMGEKEQVALTKSVVCDWDIFVEKG